MSKKKIIPPQQKQTLAVDWYVPENIFTPFATNMVVQTIENEFKLSFFEIKPPIRLDSSAPPLERVRADCVASVIVTADRLPKFIEVLQTQLNKYQLLKNKTVAA